MIRQADRARIARDYQKVVNMSAAELGDWLATAESRSVGARAAPGAESVGRMSGHRTLELLRAPKKALDGEDLLHMRRTVGFVRRHRAQEPANVVTSRWRYALMNWGHDPLKDMMEGIVG